MTTTTLSRENIGRMLEALEGPECCCHPPWERIPLEGDLVRWLGPPCRHVQASNHRLDLADWADLLECYAPEEYAEPPLPAQAVIALTREARIATMTAREAAGEALRHPDDVDELERVTVIRQPDGTEKLIVDEEGARPWYRKR